MSKRRVEATLLAVAVALLTSCAGPDPDPVDPVSLADPASDATARVELAGAIDLPRPELRWEAGPARLGARRAVLVVAADDFAEDAWNLGHVRPAAERLRDVLVDDVGLDPDDVQLLTGDRVLPDLVQARVAQLTADMQGPDNVLLVHWLGHGFNIDGRQQFLTHLSDGEPGGGYSHTLPYDQVASWVADARRDVQTRGGELATAMVVDACRVDGLGAPSRLVDHRPAFDVEAFSAQVGAPVPGGATTVPVFTHALTDALAASWQSEVGLLDALRIAEREVLATGRQQPDITTGERDVLLADRADLSVSVLAVDGLTGLPLRSARVQLNGVERESPAAFDGLAPSPEGYDLRVLAEGYFWRSESVPFDERDSGQQIVVPLMPEFVAVTGAVSVTDGGAARVHLTGSFGALIEDGDYHRTSATVGRDGAFWLPVPRTPGARDLVIEVNGSEVRRRAFDLATAPSAVLDVSGTPVTVFDLGAQVVSGTRRTEIGGGVAATVIGGVDVAFDFDSLTRDDFTDNRGWSFYSTVRTFSDRGRYASARKDLDALVESGKLAASGESAIAALAHELAVAAALDDASRLQSRGDLSGALDSLLASHTVDDTRVVSVLRSGLRADTRQRHAAHDYAGALGRLDDLAALPYESRDADGIQAEARDQLEQRRQVHVDWIEHAFQQALVDGDWDAVDAAIAAARPRGQDSGSSMALRVEVEEWALRVHQERITPACRAQYQEGVSALAAGDMSGAQQAFELAILSGSNEHYRGLIAPSLATVRDELFARSNAIAAERLAADEPTEALTAYVQAWRQDRIVEHRIDQLLASPAFDATAVTAVRNTLSALTPVRDALDVGDAETARAALDRAAPVLFVGEADVRSLRARIALLEDELASRQPSRGLGDALAAAAAELGDARAGEPSPDAGNLAPLPSDDGSSLRARLNVDGLGLTALFDREAWARLDDAGVSTYRLYIERQWPRLLQGEFRFASLERHEAGGEAHWMLHYTHEASGLEFVLVPGGRFFMGSEGLATDIPAAPIRRVELDPFLMAATEFPRGVLDDLDRHDPSTHGSFATDDMPVTDISWQTARELAGELRLELPTEAQWEYACRAGTERAFAFGDSISKDLARFDTDELSDGPADVASFAPNAFGLYDMHGNVTEWVLDAPCSYTIEPQPGDGLRECLDDSGEHITRGGDYFFHGYTCNSANRRSSSYSFQRIGFRPVRNLP